MGACIVVPGGGFRQTADPFIKIPRILAVFRNGLHFGGMAGVLSWMCLVAGAWESSL